ncbi:RidA family protein [Labrys neptuniae]
MSGTIDRLLAEKRIELPNAAVPVANYTPVVVADGTAYVSGQVCSWNGEFKFVGRVGRDFSAEEGREAARMAGLNIVAQLKNALGDLDRVKRVLRLNVFVNSAETFTEQPKVANGASDLMVEIFGDAGRHTRSAVGVAQLPLGVAVEVDAIVQVD